MTALTRKLSGVKFRGGVRQVFCGPFAASAVTGKCVEDIEERINEHRKKDAGSKITTTYNHDLVYALKKLGYRVEYEREHYEKYPCPTLARWMRERDDLEASYLVLVTGHWVAVKGRKFVDTFTGLPVFLKAAPHRRKRIQIVLRVENLRWSNN